MQQRLLTCSPEIKLGRQKIEKIADAIDDKLFSKNISRRHPHLEIGLRISPDAALSDEMDRFHRRVSVRRDDDGVDYDATSIRWRNNQWEYRNSTPSPNFNWNPSRFHFETDSDEELLAVIDRYYFMEPVRIAEWYVPIGQFPHWTIERLQEVIANATTIRLRGTDEPYPRRSTDFLVFPHHSKDGPNLVVDSYHMSAVVVHDEREG